MGAGGWSRASQFVCRPRPERVAPHQSAAPPPGGALCRRGRRYMNGATWGAAERGVHFPPRTPPRRRTGCGTQPQSVKRSLSAVGGGSAPRDGCSVMHPVRRGGGVIVKGSGYLATYGGADARRRAGAAAEGEPLPACYAGRMPFAMS